MDTTRRRRPLVRASVAAALATTVALPAAASAASPAAASRVAGAGHDHATRLAAVTVVDADRSGRAVVELPRPVTLHSRDGFGPFREIHVAGAGRITGLALAADSPRAGLVQLAYHACFSPACPTAPSGHRARTLATAWSPTDDVADTDRTTAHLPAGIYALSVYADGAPVRVTLRLPQLSGRAHLRLHLTRHATIASPPEHEIGAGPASTGAQSWATGTVHTAVTVLAQAHLTDSSPHVSSNESWCIYDGAGPPGGVLLPQCPGGSGISIGATFISRSFKGLSYGMLLTVGAGAGGRYYQGYDDRGVQLLRNAHDTFLWADAGMIRQS